MHFQFTVKHSPGRTTGMADYLSWHPSPNNKNIQFKAEELWIDRFTKNKFDHEKLVLDIQNRKGTTGQQAIRHGLATINQTAKESERSES